MTLQTIPLSELHISKLNMRHGRKAPDVSDILPSIREKGVRQTLLVRREGKQYGVVAGRRRYFALKEIEKETGSVPLVPCTVMAEADAASAIEASIVENVARLPASEMEQYQAFRRLAGEGKTPPEIALFFGVTELKVRRVLAIADLAAPIRRLYAEEKIDAETVRALTLASMDRQRDWLKLYMSKTERAPLGRACRAWVTGGQAITTDRALFDLSTYDGQVVTDLFGEHGVFKDPDQFWQAQSAAIATRAEAYKTRGWGEVVVLDRGHLFCRWDHAETKKKEGGRVYVECRHDGTVTFHEGYITQGEARKRTAGKTPPKDTTPAPDMSGPLAEYILLHRHGAAQASLIAAPAMALRLMLAHAMVGSALWMIRPHECRTRKEATRASLERSRAARQMSTAQEHVSALLASHGFRGERRRNGDDHLLCALFAALMRMDDAEIGGIAACVMAETLEAGGAAVEAVLVLAGADLAGFWSPDEAFYALLRDKRAINRMIAETGTKGATKACLTDTAAAQKTVLQRQIAAAAGTPNAQWVPGWMQVPPRPVIDGAGSPPADCWGRIAGLFDAPDTDRPAPDTVPDKETA